MSRLDERGVIAQAITVIVLILGLIAGFYLITHKTQLFSQAANPPIVVKDINGNALPTSSAGIPVTTSPTVRVYLTSTLGLPQENRLPASSSISSLSASPKNPLATTVSYKIAEDPATLTQAIALPYNQESVTLNYTFKDTTPGTKFIWVEFQDNNGKVDRQDAEIEYKPIAAQAVNTSSNVPSQALLCENYGDVDRDGKITNNDAQMILQAIANNTNDPTMTAIGDVNGDGQLTGSDALLIQQYLAGKITTFPVCQHAKPSPCGNLGDVTGDGTVSPMDAAEVLRIVAGGYNSLYTNKPYTVAQKQTADVNGDGQVTALDALLIQRYLAGTDSTFKGCSPEVINTLDYFLTKHPDKGLDGAHTTNDTDFSNGNPLSQTVEGNKSYYVKWAPDVFEVHTWDNNYIYLREDRNDAGEGTDYTFTKGEWLKRNMTVGETFAVNDNIMQNYSSTCTPLNTQSFPIKMTLEAHASQYNLGGDIGKQDVIVLKYDSSVGLSQGNYERYYYSKQWGLVRWEEYTKSKVTDGSTTEGVLTNRRTFNKIISPTPPNKTVACSLGK